MCLWCVTHVRQLHRSAFDMCYLRLATQAKSQGRASGVTGCSLVCGFMSWNQHKTIVKSTMENFEVSFFVFHFYWNQQNADSKNSLTRKSLMKEVIANRAYLLKRSIRWFESAFQSMFAISFKDGGYPRNRRIIICATSNDKITLTESRKFSVVQISHEAHCVVKMRFRN
jgi:hypothetical protein